MFATESLGTPVRRATRERFPGASGHSRLLVLRNAILFWLRLCCSMPLTGDLFQGQMPRPRTEAADDGHHYRHGGCDEHGHAGRSPLLQKEADQQAGASRTQTAPRIDEADRPAAD